MKLKTRKPKIPYWKEEEPKFVCCECGAKMFEWDVATDGVNHFCEWHRRAESWEEEA